MTKEDRQTIEEQGPVNPIWVIKTMTRINLFVYRLTKGPLMNKLGGGPICLVETTGAMTGKERTFPVMYDDFYLYFQDTLVDVLNLDWGASKA